MADIQTEVQDKAEAQAGDKAKKKRKISRRPGAMKRRIIAGALAVVVVGGGIGMWQARKGAAAVSTGVRSFSRTTTLQKSTLTESVTVTGTVESAALANVTSTQNYKVTEILVQEGDTVYAGQTLCRLDDTELREQLSKIYSNIGDSLTTAQKTYNEAVEARDEAYDNAIKQETTLADAKAASDQANAAFQTAKNSVASYQNAYNAAYTRMENAGRALNATGLESAKAAMDTAAQNKQSAEQALTAAKDTYVHYVPNPNSGHIAHTENDTKDTCQNIDCQVYFAAWQNAKTAAQTAAAAYDTAKANYENAVLANTPAQTEYDAAQTALTAAQTALDSAKQNCNYTTYESAASRASANYDSARSMLDSLEKTYKSSLKTVENALEQLNKAKTSDEAADILEQIEACTITATTGGTITQVNATVGSAPGASSGGSTLFVIQDTDHLKVAVTIDEYDISKIKTGLDAVIKSDATGDAKIEGYVSQVSLTATTGQSSSGFGAEITVNKTNSGLLIGLNAQVEIILSQKEGVYNVPYDAVGTDENGNSVVYVKNGDTFEPVAVTTGMETDYYIEIMGADLREGMEVRNSADESSIDATEGGDAGQMQQEVQMGGGVTFATADATAPAGAPPGGSGGMPQGGRG